MLMLFFRKIKGFIYFTCLSLSCLEYPEECRHIQVNGLDFLYAVRGPGDVIPNTFPWDIRPLAYEQLRNAGYRLAAVLNEIFD